jgi:prephenate dehydratase
MNKLAVLGPAGTFSELAARKYIENIDEDMEINFYSTITKVFNAVGKECEYGIIPIENTLDGYVQIVLDLFAQLDLNIASELIIPIQFAFVGNASELSEIKKIYAQFKTQGQCCNFLEQLNSTKIITTESNGDSYEAAKVGGEGEGAIVPQYLLNKESKFSLNIENVTDSKDNHTRFVVISKNPEKHDYSKSYKTSIVIMDAKDDKPGILARVLNEFASRDINLTSIISRPTKIGLGKYYFFIDVEGNYDMDENIRRAIDKISENNAVKVLGAYSLI